MHPTSAALAAKLQYVQKEAEAARASFSQRFILTPEIAPGVRLVLTETGGVPLALSLWDALDDVVALCNDAAVPAMTALLAIGDDQVHAAAMAGQRIDLGRLARSQRAPETNYALLHYASRREIRRVVNRVVSPVRPSTAAA